MNEMALFWLLSCMTYHNDKQYKPKQLCWLFVSVRKCRPKNHGWPALWAESSSFCIKSRRIGDLPL